MRYYPSGLSRAYPEDERGWHQGSAMASAPPGAPGHAPANQRTHEKVVAMRSCPTGAAPTIDAHARQLPVLSLLSARHTTDTAMTHKTRRSW
jgi:hypothetical protein